MMLLVMGVVALALCVVGFLCDLAEEQRYYDEFCREIDRRNKEDERWKAGS